MNSTLPVCSSAAWITLMAVGIEYLPLSSEPRREDPDQAIEDGSIETGDLLELTNVPEAVQRTVIISRVEHALGQLSFEQGIIRFRPPYRPRVIVRIANLVVVKNLVGVHDFLVDEHHFVRRRHHQVLGPARGVQKS